MLATWDGNTGKALADAPLPTPVGAGHAVSPDGNYLFIQSGDGEEEAWWCVSTETGAVRATLPREDGIEQPAVVGSNVYYMIADPAGGLPEPVVRARELDTGRLIWERPLDPPADKGPPPLRR